MTRKKYKTTNILKRRVDSGIAICSIVCAYPAGCIVDRLNYNCNFTYLALGDDVKSISNCKWAVLLIGLFVHLGSPSDS